MNPPRRVMAAAPGTNPNMARLVPSVERHLLEEQHQ